MSDQHNMSKSAPGVHQTVLKRLGNRGPNFARQIIFVFSAFLVGITIWASFTQVPSLIRADGALTAEGALMRIEHLEGGTVSEILVDEGDLVNQGQIIARLSSSAVDFQLEQLSSREMALAQTIYRLNALLSELPQDPTPASRLPKDAQSQRLQEAQVKLQIERRRAASELIRERASSVRIMRALRDTANARLSNADAKLVAYEKLAERGTISQLDLNQRRDERDALGAEVLQADVELSSAMSRQVDAQNSYNELILSERKDALAELNEAVDQKAELEHQIRELEFRQSQLNIRAPIDGIVQVVAVGVPGEVIEQGGHFADVLPRGVSLVADIKVAAKDVGQITVGAPVALNVTTYPRNRHGQVRGEILTISPTTFVEPNEDPYFKVSVKLDQQHIGLRGAEHPLRSGMTVQAEIVSTPRTVAQYLLKPLQATMSTAMTEK